MTVTDEAVWECTKKLVLKYIDIVVRYVRVNIYRRTPHPHSNRAAAA